MVQTKSDFYGEPDEISIYTGKGYRSRPVSFKRYTLRLDSYDSGRLFGGSVSRPIDFEKPLSDLVGKTVRMRITTKDADFYSFCFE